MTSDTETTTCWLSPFFVYTLSDAVNAGQKAEIDLEHNIGSVVVCCAILIISTVLLFAGQRMIKPLLSVVGAAAGLIASFYGLLAIDVDNCVVLSVVPLLAAAVAAFISIRLVRVAVGALGALAGAVLGRYLYALFLYRVHSGYFFADQDLVYWACVLLLGIV